MKGTQTRVVIFVVVGALSTVSLGLLGLVTFAETVLLLWRANQPTAQAWRLLALTALTTTLVAGLAGGVLGLVRGLQHPSTAYFAFLEGGVLAGAPGMLVGACVGTVLALDLRRQAQHA
jgi:hypothetical protein